PLKAGARVRVPYALPDGRCFPASSQELTTAAGKREIGGKDRGSLRSKPGIGRVGVAPETMDQTPRWAGTGQGARPGNGPRAGEGETATGVGDGESATGHPKKALGTVYVGLLS